MTLREVAAPGQTFGCGCEGGCSQMVGCGEDAPRGQWVSGNPHLGVEAQFYDPQQSHIGRARARSEME